MNNTNSLSVNKHSFDVELGKLKTLQDDIPAEIDIQDVKEKTGLFKMFDHRVTGEEVNKLTCEIEDMFILQNTLNTKLLEQFNQVYKVFNKLDTDYIQGIMIAVRNAAEASNQAKIAWEETQATVNTQKKLVDKLKVFKEHADVVSELLDFKTETEKEIKELKDFDDLTNQNIIFLNEFKELIETNDHYHEIDVIWNKQEELVKLLNENNSLIEEQKSSLVELQDRLAKEIEKLERIVHLAEVDELWDNTEKNTNDIKDLTDKQVEITNRIEAMSANLLESINKNSLDIKNLSDEQARVDKEFNDRFKNTIIAINDLEDKNLTNAQNIEELNKHSDKLESDIIEINSVISDLDKRTNSEIEELKEKNANLLSELEIQKNKLKRTNVIMYVSAGVLALLVIAGYVLGMMGII